MTILNLFIQFINSILNFKIFNVKLIDYLIGFTIVITIFKVIQSLAGIRTNNVTNDASNNKQKGGKK